MATICPICQKGTLKKGESFVYCSEKKTEKTDYGFVENGCTFKIFYDQKKIFGMVLSPSDVKNLIDGKEIISPKGHKMKLDTTSEFFTQITFAEKKEDEDL